MPILDDIQRALRDHVRFTGDGLPNAPVAAPLPVGSPRSGEHNPSKKELRDLLSAVAGVTGGGGVSISGSSYNATTGRITLTFTDGSTSQTGDLRGVGISGSSYNSGTGAITLTFTNGTTFTTGDLRGEGGGTVDEDARAIASRADASAGPGIGQYSSPAEAAADNPGGTIRINYDEQNLPADFSGVLFEYTKSATARNIQQTGPGAGVGMRTFRTQFPENHTGFQYHALNIEAVSRGSGVNGPTTVENGLTINVAKRGFASGTARAGAFNCMYLYGRQDGPKGLPAGDIGSSDIGGIIANLSIVEDAGFLCIGEATSTQIQGSAPFGQLLQLQTQYGVINGNAAGGSKSYGWLAISKVGENTAAYYASSEGSSSWSSLFLSPDKLNIDSNGDYRSTQSSWTAGALNLERDKSIVNGNSTIRHRGTGSLRILAQESANISLGTNNTIHIRLGGDGNLVPNTAGGSNIGQPASRFGGVYTNTFDAAGSVTMSALPVHADNAAAVTGGLAVGRVYRTATGELRIVI